MAQTVRAQQYPLTGDLKRQIFDGAPPSVPRHSLRKSSRDYTPPESDVWVRVPMGDWISAEALEGWSGTEDFINLVESSDNTMPSSTG